MPARRISDILDDSRELGSLAAVSRRIAQLQRAYFAYLEAVSPQLARSSRVGWARGDVVSVVADNGAVAAKLRQLTPRVLHHLRQSGFEFNSMRIGVQVERALDRRPRHGYKPLSDNALSSVERALEKVADSPLKAALARLARRR
jgi:hypothetical protein